MASTALQTTPQFTVHRRSAHGISTTSVFSSSRLCSTRLRRSLTLLITGSETLRTTRSRSQPSHPSLSPSLSRSQLSFLPQPLSCPPTRSCSGGEAPLTPPARRRQTPTLASTPLDGHRDLRAGAELRRRWLRRRRRLLGPTQPCLAEARAERSRGGGRRRTTLSRACRAASCCLAARRRTRSLHAAGLRRESLRVAAAGRRGGAEREREPPTLVLDVPQERVEWLRAEWLDESTRTRGGGGAGGGVGPGGGGSSGGVSLDARRGTGRGPRLVCTLHSVFVVYCLCETPRGGRKGAGV